MSTPDPLNTHSYDGKLAINELPELILVKELSLNQKQQQGHELLLSACKMNPKAISFLRRIVTAMGTSANIDPTNNLVADDLICLCWNYKDNPVFLSVLEAQLLDMGTGFCPQGRTHRLFQTLMAFI